MSEVLGDIVPGDAPLRHWLGGRSLVLVGMMGVGKSSVGRRLAARLDLPFQDSDRVIEEAAGLSVSEIFAAFGEAKFREVERRTITRLIEGPQQVIATGGGAFTDAGLRVLVKAQAVSIWLQATLDQLVERTARRNDRPLLAQGDPRAILARLMAERDPAYAEADLAVRTTSSGPAQTAQRVLDLLDAEACRHGHCVREP